MKLRADRDLHLYTGYTVKRLLAFALVVLGASSCGGGADALAPKDITALLFVTQPSTIAAGAPFSVSVSLVATGNKVVTASTDMVTLTVGGGATLGGTTSVAAVGGVATFTGLAITHAGSNLQLSASARGLSANGGVLAVTAGAASAAQSTVVLSPATISLNVATSAVFTFKDTYGNPVGGLNVSLSSTLSGVTFTPSSGSTNGDGTFGTSLRATALGSGLISATVGSASINVGNTINVVPAVSAVRFVTQPSAVVAGVPFNVAVELIDGTGQRVTTATNSVVLTTSAGGATIGTIVAVAGLATFNNLSLNTVASNVVLTATSGTLTVAGTAFSIAAGPPSLAQSTITSTSGLSVGVAISGTFTIKDAFSNPIALAPIALTTSIAGTTFTPSSGTTSATGAFTSSVNPGTAGAGTITATVNGVAVVFPVTVLPPCVIGAATLSTPVADAVTAASGCVQNNHIANIYRFAVPASPTSTILTVTGVGQGTFFPEFSVTTDPATTTGGFGVGNPPSGTGPQTLTNGPTEWLLPSGGSFLASISSANGNAGSFTLTLANSGVGGSGCGDPHGNFRLLLGVNATYTGQTLAATDCIDNTSAPPAIFYYDAFLINDTRPCTISMQATYGIYLEIDDANTTLGSAGSASTTTSGSVSLASCRSGGPIRVFPSSWDPSITGPYTLTVAFTGSGAQSASLMSPGTHWFDAASLAVKRALLRK